MSTSLAQIASTAPYSYAGRISDKGRLTFHVKAPVEVSRLQLWDVPLASKTHGRAFKNDSLIRYTKNRQGDRPVPLVDRIIERAQISAYLVIRIRTRATSLTIDSGKANVLVNPPKDFAEPPKRDPVVWLAKWALNVLGLRRKQLESRDTELVKRRVELEERLMSEEAYQRFLGDRVDKIWYVDGIFTDPESQGRGYGGALLEAATTMADASGRAIWLVSSNIANTTFYNQHGFETTETIFMGDKNPNWHDKPIPVCIMIREPITLPDKVPRKCEVMSQKHPTGLSVSLNGILL